MIVNAAGNLMVCRLFCQLQIKYKNTNLSLLPNTPAVSQFA